MFAPVDIAADTVFRGSLDFSRFLYQPTLSDLTITLDDGSQFHAHRIILCAQSEFFAAMFETDRWAESKSKEVGVCVHHISSFVHLSCHVADPLPLPR